MTTVQQKISASGGCSLQEAIDSANVDNNVAIATYTGSTPVEVVTECVPGSGDDIIVLPAGAVFRLSKLVDDHNPAPGQSVIVQLRFENSVDDVVTYTARALAGKGSR